MFRPAVRRRDPAAGADAGDLAAGAGAGSRRATAAAPGRCAMAMAGGGGRWPRRVVTRDGRGTPWRRGRRGCRYCSVVLHCVVFDALGATVSVVGTLGEALPAFDSLGETLSLTGSLALGVGEGVGEFFVGVGDGLCVVGPGPGVGRRVGGLCDGVLDGVVRPVPVGAGAPVVPLGDADGDLDRALGDSLVGAGLSVSATEPGVALDSAAGGRLGGA